VSSISVHVFMKRTSKW